MTDTAPMVVLAGGGTGGHVVPALALADAFKAAGSPVVFVGTAHGYETRMVPKRGYTLHTVQGSRLVGGGMLSKLRGLRALWRGVREARALFRQLQPKLVVGVGGYASGAALLAARSMGIACAIHESNAVPGLTNKVLGLVVHRVYLGFSAARNAFSASKTLVSGNPVRAEIAAVSATRAYRGDRPARVLVVGGSQGSEFLNQHVPKMLGKVRQAGMALEIRHQVGKLAPAPVQAAYAECGLEASVEGFIDDMAGAYAWADFAVTRAGSGTVAELAAAALPALLVPFPYAAGDHQAANAQAYCKPGSGAWVRQTAWRSDEVAHMATTLFGSELAWTKCVTAARAMALPDAAGTVVRDCGNWVDVPAWREVKA